MRVCSVCHRCYENAVTDCIEDGHPVLFETRVYDLESVNGYRIERLLDLGNKAETYLARHVATGRSCLIKIHNATGERRERFLRDAEKVAALFHPGVADVYESGEFGSGEVFVVAEHVSGPTLGDLLKSDGPPELLTTIVLVRQAAEALHTIHQHGLVHRCVRPENIVVSTDTSSSTSSRIQNIDLGGVIEHSIVADKFTIDSAIDSLRYFAPEQCSSEPVTPQTDVYSLGVVLYEMIAGRPPFDDSKASGLIEMHRNRRPPDIRIEDFELRMLITHTLTESLNKRPQNRQSSANAFARQLRHMEQLATHVSTPPPAVAVPAHTAKSVAAVSVSGFTQSVPIYSDPVHSTGSMSGSAEKTIDSSITIEDNRPAVVVSLSNDAELPGHTEPEPQQPQLVERSSRLKLRRRKLHARSEPAIAVSDEPRIVPPVQANAVEELARSHRKIEWETPDDDIPTMDDVIAALTNADTKETVPASEQQPVTAAEQLIDAIPEVKIPATPKLLIEIKAETVLATTHLRDSDQIVEPASKGLSKDIPIKSKPKQAPRGSTTRTPKPTPAVLTDADEITAVTARSKPILIQFDPHTKPRSRAPIRQVVPQPSNDIPFSLTLLGQQRLATPEPAHTFLAEYSVPDRSISFRTAAVGVGLAAAIALFLFSGGAWNRLATLASADRPEIEPQSQQSIVVDKPQVPITKPEKKPARSFENPEPRPLQSITEVSKPDPAKDRSPSASAKPQPVTNKETPEATKPTRDKTVKARVNDIEKRSVEKKQPLPQRKTDGSTRPRIVKISSS